MVLVHPLLIYLVAIVLGVVLLLVWLAVFAVMGTDLMLLVGAVLFVLLYIMYRLKHVAEQKQQDAMQDAGEE